MSTIEDFENAPVGATATDGGGSRALKMDDVERRWILQNGLYLNDKEMEHWDYTLDPLNPVAPATAREALDLAWELAHEVKEGQYIPKGARYVRRSRGGGWTTFTASEGWTPTPRYAVLLRTLDPLPDPEPDWLNAPAVLAHTDNDDTRRVWTARRDEQWSSTSHTYTRRWRDLRDVTPLYPKEGNR